MKTIESIKLTKENAEANAYAMNLEMPEENTENIASFSMVVAKRKGFSAYGLSLKNGVYKLRLYK